MSEQCARILLIDFWIGFAVVIVASVGAFILGMGYGASRASLGTPGRDKP